MAIAGRACLCQMSGALPMSNTAHADAPFLRRVLAVLVLATALSGGIAGAGVMTLSSANAGTSTVAYGN